MYDMQGIYEHVLQHETLRDGTRLIGPPDGFGLDWKRGDMQHISLIDSWKPKRKNAQMTVWKFTITPDGVSLKCYKKSLDHETILAIAESYHRLISLIEPYCDGVEYGE
jgi:hypothetical protein